MKKTMSINQEIKKGLRILLLSVPQAVCSYILSLVYPYYL